MHMYMYIYIYMYTSININLYVHTYIHIHVHVHICICICIYIHIYSCTYIYIYIYVYICIIHNIYIYIYVYIWSFSAKEPRIIGLFCGKLPMKTRHLVTLRHPVWCMCTWIESYTYVRHDSFMCFTWLMWSVACLMHTSGTLQIHVRWRLCTCNASHCYVITTQVWQCRIHVFDYDSCIRVTWLI